MEESEGKKSNKKGKRVKIEKIIQLIKDLKC